MSISYIILLLQFTIAQFIVSQACQQTSACIVECECYLYQISWISNTESQVTIDYNVTNYCAWDVSYVAFGTSGLTVLQPENGSSYTTGNSIFHVVFTNFNGNPGFPSTKFEVTNSNHFKNGNWEILSLIVDVRSTLLNNISFLFQTHSGPTTETAYDINIGACGSVEVSTINEQVTTEQVTTGQVTTGQETTGQVTTGQVTTGQVTTEQVTTGQVTTGQVTTEQVATGQVTTGQVTTEQVATGQVTTGQVTTGQVTNWNRSLVCSQIIDGICDSSLVLGNESYSFDQFHFVSFNNFYGSTGDVQGRLAVQNNLDLGAGYSIGEKITDNDMMSYSAVIGHNVTWLSGALLPIGSKSYVGENFIAPIYLQETRSNIQCSDCTDIDFHEAHICYSQLSSALFGQTQNLNWIFSEDHLLTLICGEIQPIYYIHIAADILSQVTYYTTYGCVFNSSSVVINVNLNSNLSLIGNMFPPFKEVIYNMPNAGRTNIFTEVRGHILMPNGIYYQSGGVVQGKVIANNALYVHQVNILCL